MTYTILKFGLSAAVIVAVSEIAKRSSLLGGLLASLPLTSLLAFVWLWQDTRDAQKVAALSSSILWLVLPSLVLFLVLPALLKRGVHFYRHLGLRLPPCWSLTAQWFSPSANSASNSESP